MSRRPLLVFALVAVLAAAWWCWTAWPASRTANPLRAAASVVAAPGRETNSAELARSPHENESATRASATLVQLLCVDAANRAPIAGARAGGPDGVEAITDVRGSVRIALMRVEGAALRVTADGYTPSTVELDPRAVERGETIVCALERASTTQALASFEVCFLLPGPRVLEPLELIVERRDAPDPAASDFVVREWRCDFDADMRARVGRLPLGVELFGSVRRRGRVVFSASLGEGFAPGETRRVVWRAITARVHVSARETGGAPAADVEVWLAKGNTETGDGYFMPLEHPVQVARTDARGRCVFVDVEPGSWRIGPARASPTDSAREDELPCALARAVDVQSGAPIDVELVIRRGRFIRGLVLGPDAKPHGEGVVLALANEQQFLTADVASDGRFQVGPLLPGRYKLSVFEAQDDLLTSSVAEAEPGATDVILRLRAGAVVSGRVVGFDPSTTDRPWVQLDGEGIVIGRSLQCAEDGTFRFEGMADADYVIRTEHTDDQIAALTGVKVHDAQDVSGLVLQLQPAAKLRVTRAGSVTVRVRVTHGLGVVDELVLTDNQQVTRLLIAGAAIVEVLDEHGTTRRRHDLALVARETRELVVSTDD